MKKVMEINGMTCGHCEARVSKALNALEGVEAKVDHKKNKAVLEISGDVADDVLMDAVKEAGYEPVSIAEKKGLFG